MSVSAYDTEQVIIDTYKDTMYGIDILDARRFFSEGPNGRFELRSFITTTKNDQTKQLLNVGFGVWDDALQKVDDRIETRNNDMRQILGTMAVIALDFLYRHPSVFLYAEGSTPTRTRLYQREISKILNELPSDLQLHGLIRAHDTGFVRFRQGTNFDAFLLSLNNR